MPYKINAVAGFSVVAAVFAMGSAPAEAQVAKPFQGFHAEGLVGYDHVSTGIDGDDLSADGVQYGGGIGSDFQFGKVVVGFGSEYSGSTIKVREQRSDLRRNDLRPGGDFYIGGRLGFVVAPATMVYVKGGYTSTKLKFRSEDFDGETLEDRPKAEGYRIGVGVEQQIGAQPKGRGLFVKAEYRYSNYTNLRVTDFDDEATDFDIDLDRSQLVFGVGFRF